MMRMSNNQPLTAHQHMATFRSSRQGIGNIKWSSEWPRDITEKCYTLYVR